MKKQEKEKIIKEIKKEDIQERFPIKKEVNIKEEISKALKIFKGDHILSELSFIVSRQKEDKLFLERDVKKLQDILQDIAMIQITLEKIQ